MHTLIEYARKGNITEQMQTVAQAEGIDADVLRQRIATGSIVIMQRDRHMTGIGKGLSTKINVNLGTSTGKVSVADEIKKVRIAEEFGADTISDLSMGGEISTQSGKRFFQTPPSLLQPSPSTRQWLRTD